MLIDAFPFFNELDLLEIRLEYLNDIVDYFVIVEAGKTQSLLDKPFYYERDHYRFHKYYDKIIHVKVEDYPDTPGWAMENHQRNCITRGLSRFKGDDLIMISDLDEIPNKQSLAAQLLPASINLNTVSFSQAYFAYYLNLACLQKGWYGTVLTNVHSAKTLSPQALRNNKDHCDHVDGGWHFGWCGGWDKVKEKLISCIEPFDKNLDFKELEKFYKNHSKDGGYFIHSDNPYDISTQLKKVSLDCLPPNIEANKHMYTHLILE